MTVLRGDADRTAAPEGVDRVAADVAEFVEDFGMAMESAGVPRAAGRLMAWLLVCDPPEQSAEDLGRALQASAGGVSTNVRLLMQYRFVERVGKAGDRRAYYRVAADAWSRVMAAQEEETSRFRVFGERGLRLLAGQSPARRERLVEMRDFFAFLEREMPALRRRYHEEKGIRS